MQKHTAESIQALSQEMSADAKHHTAHRILILISFLQPVVPRFSMSKVGEDGSKMCFSPTIKFYQPI